MAVDLEALAAMNAQGRALADELRARARAHRRLDDRSSPLLARVRTAGPAEFWPTVGDRLENFDLDEPEAEDGPEPDDDDAGDDASEDMEAEI